ncbi:MAG: hypothetical protein ABI199_00295 [Bacteroidia bacterium]
MEGITELKVEKSGNDLRLCFELKAVNLNRCFVISDTDGNILLKGVLEESKSHQIAISFLKKGSFLIHIIEGEKLFFSPFSIE